MHLQQRFEDKAYNVKDPSNQDFSGTAALRVSRVVEAEAIAKLDRCQTTAVVWICFASTHHFRRALFQNGLRKAR